MSSADTLDLSRLDAAPLVATDFSETLATRLAAFAALYEQVQTANPGLPPLDTLTIPTEPVHILNRHFAAAEMLIASKINAAAGQLRLASAAGPALDHLAATYHRTTRLPGESDEELRGRAQLAPEALAEMGMTPGGYIYKIRTAFGDRIKDVRPINRGDGHVELRLLGRTGSGAVDSETLAAIIRAFQPDEAEQSTDIVSVLSANIITPSVDLVLVAPRGPDPAALIEAARRSVATYAAGLHRIGSALYVQALGAAAHVAPVTTVRVRSPLADLVIRPEQAVYLAPDAVSISVEVQS
ncbi:baseplate J/gp47 family protein [Notoacmeibacter ruber]|uniref:Uncharacterized protein n=1 Tax=Notoacmeibacter ruber TaxID=2670375 RepID=A0A3L7JDR9_9HYPH|nr:baseplate J/gp47 family protein [Notoacmeibacter ruber]RLQ88917.1 hypothetical protein D8780_12450 [Notoacmeibacter ruber]